MTIVLKYGLPLGFGVIAHFLARGVACLLGGHGAPFLAADAVAGRRWAKPASSSEVVERGCRGSPGTESGHMRLYRGERRRARANRRSGPVAVRRSGVMRSRLWNRARGGARGAERLRGAAAFAASGPGGVGPADRRVGRRTSPGSLAATSIVLDPGHNGGNARAAAAINRLVAIGQGAAEGVRHDRHRDQRAATRRPRTTGTLRTARAACYGRAARGSLLTRKDNALGRPLHRRACADRQPRARRPARLDPRRRRAAERLRLPRHRADADPRPDGRHLRGIAPARRRPA